MPQHVIDLRSDTVTKPTVEMRLAMANAEVGDDVIDVDPTVDRLQRRLAEMLGMEAALFMPSGTMTNQVAVRIHCKPGDEFLCDAGCHVYNYEQGAFAQLSGVVARTLTGDYGVLRREQLEGQIRPENEHLVRTRLLCLENTHNRGGGKVYPYEILADCCQWAQANGLRRHLDGARLFNAVVATGVSAERWAKHFDTVSVCFSKGLGAPVGSALAGPADLIREARRHRKLLGGGMRQAGVIAAGALYALERHVERLKDDHANARILADAIRQCEPFTLEPPEVETNIVIFRVDRQFGTAHDVAARLNEQGVHVLAISPTQIRAVTHLDVDERALRRAADVLIALACGAAIAAHGAPRD
jgi:threonine aldolase